jgi:hypothetical protein
MTRFRRQNLSAFRLLEPRPSVRRESIDENNLTNRNKVVKRGADVYCSTRETSIARARGLTDVMCSTAGWQRPWHHITCDIDGSTGDVYTAVLTATSIASPRGLRHSQWSIIMHGNVDGS